MDEQADARWENKKPFLKQGEDNSQIMVMALNNECDSRMSPFMKSCLKLIYNGPFPCLDLFGHFYRQLSILFALSNRSGKDIYFLILILNFLIGLIKHKHF